MCVERGWHPRTQIIDTYSEEFFTYPTPILTPSPNIFYQAKGVQGVKGKVLSSYGVSVVQVLMVFPHLGSSAIFKALGTTPRHQKMPHWKKPTTLQPKWASEQGDQVKFRKSSHEPPAMSSVVPTLPQARSSQPPSSGHSHRPPTAEQPTA